MSKNKRTTQKKAKPAQKVEANPFPGQLFRGVGRIILVVGILALLSMTGGRLFEPQDALTLARQAHETGLIGQFLPVWLLVILVPLYTGGYSRYMLPALGAMIFVIIAAASYVQDIYALPSFRRALRYVFSSLFAVNYPRLVIDGGQKKIPEGETHVLDAIGGPGFVLIQPGNAVMFRKLRSPSRASVTRSYFMGPFETIGHITSLDDQHGYIDKVETVSSDGIRMAIRDIHFRFKILPETKDGKPVPRSLENPYPYSEEAMKSMAHNLVVTESGPPAWHRSVQRALRSGINQYVNSHTVDYLTAPRKDEQDPRGEISRILTAPATAKSLASLGADLLWVDIGHLDIIPEDVDQSRLKYWEARFVGDSKVARAFGDATRQAYQELGRAESNAALIVSIADALKQVDQGENPAENMKKILLARTAQILDAISSQQKP